MFIRSAAQWTLRTLATGIVKLGESYTYVDENGDLVEFVGY
jgi:hypothetical protein